jgi:hypothetical protein
MDINILSLPYRTILQLFWRYSGKNENRQSGSLNFGMRIEIENSQIRRLNTTNSSSISHKRLFRCYEQEGTLCDFLSSQGGDHNTCCLVGGGGDDKA